MNSVKHISGPKNAPQPTTYYHVTCQIWKIWKPSLRQVSSSVIFFELDLISSINGSLGLKIWNPQIELTYKCNILYDLQHDLQPGFHSKELVLKLSWFELTPRVYSSSGFSIDLIFVTLRQQNVEKVPSLVCIQSTLKWISIHFWQPGHINH